MPFLKKTVSIITICFILVTAAGTKCSYSETVSLEVLEEEAIEHSPDLEKNKIEKRLRQEELQEQRYDFYPTLQAQGNTEHSSDLSNGWGSVVSVGDIVQSTGTKFQNSVSVRANYVLYDFGVRSKKHLALKRTVQASGSTERATKLQLRLDVLSTYATALSLSQEIDCLKQVVEYSNELALLNNRLWKGGKKTPIDIARQDAYLKKKENELFLRQFEFQDALEDLSFYIGHSLNEDVRLKELPRPILSAFPYNIEKHPEVEKYAHAAASQQAKSSAAVGNYFPKISLYGSYLLYGSDANDMGNSYADISESNATVGLAITVPVSDAFRNVHRVRQSRLKEQQIKAEKRKKEEELRTEFKQSQLQYKYLLADRKQKLAMVKIIESELEMLTRMREAKAIDAETAIVRAIELLDEKIALNRSVVRLAHELLRLQYQVEATRCE